MNDNEAEAVEHLRGLGYTVIVDGWPDLLVIDGDDIFCVELKSENDTLRPGQRDMHRALALAGMQVRVARYEDIKQVTRKSGPGKFLGETKDLLKQVIDAKRDMDENVVRIRAALREVDAKLSDYRKVFNDSLLHLMDDIADTRQTHLQRLKEHDNAKQ